MPDYRIFVLKDGHIKEPAQIISCPDDEAATEEARQLLGWHRPVFRSLAERPPHHNYGTK
jgi:hypothetical protein